MGYSPWGHKESDMTERLHFHFLSYKEYSLPSGKESACQTGDVGLIPGLGRFLGEGNGNPLWYSCLGNSMDRGAWQAVVQGVAKELDMT